MSFLCSLLILLGCGQRDNSHSDFDYESYNRKLWDSLVAPPLEASARYQKGQEIFYVNCASCHAIEHKVIDPPLKGIIEKRDPKWLRSFIINAPKMIREKDLLAFEVYKRDSPMIMMPTLLLEDTSLYNPLMEYIMQGKDPVLHSDPSPLD